MCFLLITLVCSLKDATRPLVIHYGLITLGWQWGESTKGIGKFYGKHCDMIAIAINRNIPDVWKKGKINGVMFHLEQNRLYCTMIGENSSHLTYKNRPCSQNFWSKHVLLLNYTEVFLGFCLLGSKATDWNRRRNGCKDKVTQPHMKYYITHLKRSLRSHYLLSFDKNITFCFFLFL